MGFIAGLFLGLLIGVFIMCLLNIERDINIINAYLKINEKN